MKKIVLLLCLIAPLFGVYGQKVKQTGSIAPLKGEKIVNLQYTYDGLLVGKIDEPSYITKKVTEYNTDEAGKGDKWKEAWGADRKTKYQPKFEELFNKYAENIGMTAKEGNSGAKYTLVIKTKVIEPGFNVGVARKPAYIDVVVDVVETAILRKQSQHLLLIKFPEVVQWDMISTADSVSRKLMPSWVKKWVHYLQNN